MSKSNRKAPNRTATRKPGRIAPASNPRPRPRAARTPTVFVARTRQGIAHPLTEGVHSLSLFGEPFVLAMGEGLTETLLPMKQADRLFDLYESFTGTDLPRTLLRDSLAAVPFGDIRVISLFDARGHLVMDIDADHVYNKHVLPQKQVNEFFDLYMEVAAPDVMWERLMATVDAHSPSMLR